MENSAAPRSTSAPLNLRELFRRTWEMFSADPIEHLVAGLTVCILSVLTLGVLFGPLLVLYIRVIERQRRGEPISVAQLFDFGDVTLQAVGAAAVVGIGFIFGVVLFVLPALIVLLAWGYAFWFIANENQDVIEALSSSWRLLKANFSSVLAVWAILLVVGAMGVAALIGVVIALPLTTIFATIAFADMRH